MELFAEGLSVVGAMLLSVSCGLLVEELLFGGLVRLFFSRQPLDEPGPERTRKGRVKGNACTEGSADRRGSAVCGCRIRFIAV